MNILRSPNYLVAKVARATAIGLLTVAAACSGPTEKSDVISHGHYETADSSWDVECHGSNPRTIKLGDTVFGLMTDPENGTTLVQSNKSWADMPPEVALAAAADLNDRSVESLDHIQPNDVVQIAVYCAPTGN